MSRAAKVLAATILCLASAGLAGPAWAGAPNTTLYAYADGSAVSPTDCPEQASSSSSAGCSLEQALSLATANTTIMLATPASVADYSGTFTIDTTVTKGGEVTIKADPKLGENARLVGDQTGASIITNSAILRLENLTFTNLASVTARPAKGGALNNSTGQLTVINCVFDGNQAVDGGAIDNADATTGSLTVDHSIFRNNHSANGGTGAAIDNADNGGNGNTTVTASVFSNNESESWSGGAIDNADDAGTGTLTVHGSAFLNNVAAFSGGAINNSDFGGHGTLIVGESLIKDNSVKNGVGAAVHNAGSGSATIYTTTIIGNANLLSAVPDSVDTDANATFEFAANAFADQCTFAGTIVDHGYNVSSDPSCASNPATPSDYVDSILALSFDNLDTSQFVPFLRPRFDAGVTGAMLPNTSVTFSALTVQLCPRTDIRGVAALPSWGCDAGSVNVLDPGPVTITSTSGSFGTPLPLTFDGGNGSTGAVHFVIASGSTAKNCRITGTAQAPTLTTDSAGNCSVIVTIDGDTYFNTISSNLTIVSIAPTKPSAPRAAVASSRNKAAFVKWSAAPSNGGEKPTYVVTASPLVNGAARTCTTSGLSCTVIGLKNKVSYRFTVVTSNSVGSSSAAKAGPVVVGTPSAPRAPRAVKNYKKSSVTVSWSAPALTNGGPITSYQVAWSTNGGKSFSAWKSVGQARSVVRAGLKYNTTYAFKVRAVNASGPGDVVTLYGIALYVVGGG